MKLNLKLVIEIIIGIIVITTILFQINLSEVISILSKIDYLLLFAAIMTYIFTLGLTA